MTALISRYAERLQFHPQRVEWVTKLIDTFSQNFDVYPSLKEIEALCKEVRLPKVSGPKAERWRSERVPGMPASIEALCKIIEGNGERGLVWGLKFCNLKMPKGVKLDADLMWAIYESWTKGELHPALEGYSDPNLHEISNMLADKPSMGRETF